MKTSTSNTALIAGLILSSTFACAEQQPIDTCIAEIQKEKSGEIIKLEKLNVQGKAVYEFELKDAKGFEWEFMCDSTGKITERESEVTAPSADAFKKTMKVSEKEAAAIALKAHPGKIQEVEYEVEENGNGSYEFDIVNDQSVETKVEVDAASGKIIEVSTEDWEIGEESEEKR